MAEQRLDPKKKGIDLRDDFLWLHREEFLQFIKDNPPVFRKEKWSDGKKTLVVWFVEGKSVQETENIAKT